MLTCAMSSRQLKMYLRASLDLIAVSPSWSSGVCGRHEADVALQTRHTHPQPLDRHYLHSGHYSYSLVLSARSRN